MGAAWSVGVEEPKGSDAAVEPPKTELTPDELEPEKGSAATEAGGEALELKASKPPLEGNA